MDKLNSQAYLILESSIYAQVGSETSIWIKSVITNSQEYSDPVKLSFNIASVPRRLGGRDRDLLFKVEDDRCVDSVCSGWQPEKWSLAEAIRVLFNLHAIYKTDHAAKILSSVYQFTELNEQTAFLKGLPLYPQTSFFVDWAKEAVRTNTRSVFAAVALFNPYPAENFSEAVWNNMVLKAVSWNYSLQDIYGMVNRDNAALAQMFNEYAREQIGAKRPVSQDLSTYIRAHADDDIELLRLASLLDQ